MKYPGDSAAIFQEICRSDRLVHKAMDAARCGKQVAVLVEITARFDEAPNIGWVQQLEQIDAQVTYRAERLKTDVKLALIVREEKHSIRR